MLWEHLREEEFEDAVKRSGGVCVIPLGCIEKHGQHLPQGTDYYAVMDILEKATKIEDVVIFPTGFWFGNVSGYHASTNFVEKRCRGSIAINLDTLTRGLEELCDEIARNGFTKIIFHNGHGGNSIWLWHFIKRMELKKKPYATFFVRNSDQGDYPDAAEIYEAFLARRDEFPMLTDEDMKVLEEWSKKGFGGAHACFRETAHVMSKHPHLAVPERYDAESGHSIHRTELLDKLGVDIRNSWDANYPNAFDGNAPFGCSHTIGQAITQLESERIARILTAVKNDQTYVEAAQRLS